MKPRKRKAEMVLRPPVSAGNGRILTCRRLVTMTALTKAE
jgi:hypothetical protein